MYVYIYIYIDHCIYVKEAVSAVSPVALSLEKVPRCKVIAGFD
jgi:hypothetical protein